MSEQSTALQTSVGEGSAVWLDTLSDLIDPFFVADRKNSCAAQYAESFSGQTGCAFRFYMVLERRGVDEAAIVYARTEAASAADLRALDLPPGDDQCPQFIQCIAATRLGATVTVAEADWKQYAVHQSLIASWADSVDDDKLLPYAKMLEEAHQREHKRASTPAEELKARQLGRQAEYYREKARRAATLVETEP